MHYEAYNIQQTRKAACNTGNKDLSVAPISAYVMPGYSLPVQKEKPKEAAFLKNLLKTLSAKDIRELIKELGE